MSLHPQNDDPRSKGEETPEAQLDAFRHHPEWTDRQREAHLLRLVARAPRERLLEAVQSRLNDLSGPAGEAVLRLVEALATPALLNALAKALEDQPALPPERAWEALELLDGAGMLDDYPELAGRRDELDETLDEDESLDELAEQIEGDSEGRWLALQGLGAVEPEIRPQIIEGLARVPIGPGLAEFLRLLCFAHDPATRAAALDSLAQRDKDDPHAAAAWAALAADHPDPEVVARARKWLGTEAEQAIVRVGDARPGATVVRSLVSALDGQGRGSIVLGSVRGGTHATVAFACDVSRGVCDVIGQLGSDTRQAGASFDGFAGQIELESVADSNELALRLLAGTVLLCGPETPPALQYWLELAVPAGFRPLPFPTPFPGWDPASLPMDQMPRRVRDVLDACPSWLDDSPLTYELAEEIMLRESSAAPDPRRDASAYRYLFEHRLLDQLELYRRMLYWMASYWQASDQPERGHSALALAWQLSDAQHAVPGHPFPVALITRSLQSAQANLGQGLDPRRLPTLPGA